MRARLRPVAVAAVAVVLLVLGGTTAYAAWSRSQVLAPGTVSSGSFALTASLPIDVSAMYPGQVRTGLLTVSRTAGTQGRWVYTLGAPTVTGTLAGQLTVAVYPTAACTGATLTLPWTVPTAQALAATPQHCVTATLSATASSSMQAATATLTVPVTGENRPTN